MKVRGKHFLTETVARPSHGCLMVSAMKIMRNSYETVATESKEFYASLSMRRLARSPGLLANATGLCFTSHGRRMGCGVEFCGNLGMPSRAIEEDNAEIWQVLRESRVTEVTR